MWPSMKIDVKTGAMPLSELDAIINITDYRLRKFLNDNIFFLQQIERELSAEDISVEQEIKLKQAKEMVQENIRRARVSGIL